jgi:hypothetical protein
MRMIKSRGMIWAGHVTRMEEKRKPYRIFVGEPEGKRPLRRLRHRWVDNIKMDLREIRWDDMDLIGLAQDRDLRVPQNPGKFLSSCTIGGFSRRA